MSQLSESRTINDSPASHITDHAELARLHNVLDGGSFMWTPADQGLIAMSGDPYVMTNSFQLIDADLWLIKLPIRYSSTISNFNINVQTGGGSAITHCFMGLYNTSGTLLARTDDLTNNWNTSGFKTHNITKDGSGSSISNYVAAAASYYVGFFCNGGTMPSINNTQNNGPFLNMGMGSLGRSMTEFSSHTTALPNPWGSPNVGTGISFWVGLS